MKTSIFLCLFLLFSFTVAIAEENSADQSVVLQRGNFDVKVSVDVFEREKDTQVLTFPCDAKFERELIYLNACGLDYDQTN